jgi:response regulator RpfG family c-di-GMP phosphodiesterase
VTIEERIEFLLQSSESHDKQIGELTEKVSQLTDAVGKLVTVSNEDANLIRSLARIAESHEHRISDLEGQ